MPSQPMTSWKITGIMATVLIVLAIPMYLAVNHSRAPYAPVQAPADADGFVGSRRCKDCHKQEYDRWNGSHHQRAMAVATEATVLGNFDNVEFTHFGRTSRFFRKDGKYQVSTPGPDGDIATYEVTHTFGWYPLQQYLVPFSGGRLQCLPIAWDVKREQWYHLYPDTPVDPDDWLYWTNNSQNWNGMCAECHSTNLKKNYDHNTDTYDTTWSEISVGCEACHGPGADHVRWAELPDMARPDLAHSGLSVQTVGLSADRQIQLCAPCHSRRMSLVDNIHQHADFLDYAVPQLLSENMYFADGQILEEVYVYGSFLQSKMYDRGIQCSDCHDVHSVKRIIDGNDLCLQCHKRADYDTRDHHFHKKAGENGQPIVSPEGKVLFDVGTGARCENCHMPGRYYMGIDYRPDHSFRIPRPDLSQTIGSPNACNRCHADKTAQWSIDALAKWYGQRKRSHYGAILAAGRNRQPNASVDLADLAADRLYPDIVRATALSLLAASPDSPRPDIFHRSLNDESSLVRYTAVRHLMTADAQTRVKLLAPLLYDPVKAVRMEAARSLSGRPAKTLPADTRRQYQKVLAIYQQAMERTADFPSSRHNLGNLYADLGQTDQAMRHYRRAIAIDNQFFPAKVNLAMLYDRQGDKDNAEILLREVVRDHPELNEIRYSLGLLLVEKRKFDEAVVFLKDASDGLPRRARIHYNLGLLLQQLKRDAEAEQALQKALQVEPENPDFLYALAVFYTQNEKIDQARHYANLLANTHPDFSLGKQLLEFLSRRAE